MSEFTFLSAAEARSMLTRRQISSVEYTQALLDHIESSNERLAAFIDLYPEQALAAARSVDDLRAAGAHLPPLAGIPYALKDLIDVAGKATTAQSQASSRNPARDAAVATILRDAHAILLGKLTLEEWGIGSPLDDLPWPPARNPWALDHTPGGSSSGCAVALSAGLIPLAVGTDTAGSVRNPAALCGIVGLKPSRGRISRVGVVPLSWTLDHVGPMARTADDCRLLFDTLAKPHESPPAYGGLAHSLAGLRICLAVDTLDEELCSADTKAALVDACRVFEALGATIVTVPTPNFRLYYDALLTVLHAEAYRHHRPRLEASPRDYGFRAYRSLMTGAAISSGEYVKARSARAALAAELACTFASCDVLLMPAVNGPASPLRDEEALARAGRGVLRAAFNLSGNPALSLCAGFSSTSLPLAMQLVGNLGADELVLDVAAAFQRVTNWHAHHPGG